MSSPARELVNRFKRAFGRGPQPEPEPAFDGDALALGNEFMEVYRNAVSNNRSLSGQLDDRKTSIESAILAQQYPQARQQIDEAKRLLGQEESFQSVHAPIAAALEEVSQVSEPLEAGLEQKRSTIARAHQSIAENCQALRFDVASQIASKVAPALPPFQEALKTFRADREQFGIAYGAHEKRIAVLLAMGDKIPLSLKGKRDALKTANDDVQQKVAVNDFGAALALVIPGLTDKVNDCHRAYEVHDRAFKAYYAKLKTLTPRIGAIDKAITAKAHGDPPPQPVATAVAAYTQHKAAVIIEQNKRDYEPANTELAKLETAVGAVEKARLEELDSEISGADTPDKVKDVVAKMQANEIGVLPARTQVELLTKLQNGRGLGDFSNEQKETLYKLYNNIPMDPDFVAKDDQCRKQLVDTLSADEKFKEAKAKWGDPDWPDDKRKEALQHIAAKQCELMGHDSPAPTITFPATRKCRMGDSASHPQVCPNRRVDVALDAHGEPTVCPSCGADNRYFYGTLGGCSAAYPASITLNSAAECGFGDLNVILDTLIHENSHAYQNMLIDQLRKGTLTEGAPEYWQAKLFAMNDALYVGNTQGNPNQALAYHRQPLEIHAQKMGPMARDSLMGIAPPETPDLA